MPTSLAPELAPADETREGPGGDHPRPSHRSGAARGFTILEILIVLAILGMLVGVLMSGLKKGFDSGKAGIAKLMVQQTLHSSLTRYNIDMGNYPTTEEGLAALIKAPADKTDQWKGPYYDSPGGKVPQDPWSHDYKYVCPGVHNKDGYDLWSMGPDGVDGTADDIGNW